ncbi:MAG: putative Ig domain-containing protein, partial [Deltaproteobacteria bacterium]|nr:putative Ig domain-containing protein [Deltaproteobacteria bacterium]
LPPGLLLAANGTLSGTPAQLGTSAFSVIATDANGCTGTLTYTLGIQCPAINIAPATLPAALFNQAYNQTLTGSGGVGPYTFALHAGSALPPGLNLVGNAISGTPTQNGTFTFTIDVSDTGLGIGPSHCAGSRSYTVTVGCTLITLGPLPTSANAGAAFEQIIPATPAISYTFALANGTTLPPGLNLLSNAITGTPTQTGTFSFTITATDANGCSGSRSYNLTVNCPAAITLGPASLPQGAVGASYNQTLLPTPAGMYSYSLTSGALPLGLSLNAASGVISGTPSQSGTSSFTVTALGFGGCTGQRSFTLTVACSGSITLPAPPLPNATAGVNYSQSLAATPAGSYSYSLVAGNLPSGLTFNSQTGALTGLTMIPGTYSFEIQAQVSSTGCSVRQAYTLVVVCPAINVAPASLPAGATGMAYSQMLSATPATAAYSFTVSNGALPTGLTLNSATGLLSGTPTQSGTFTFTVRATGFGTCTGATQYTLVISANCQPISLPALPNGTVGRFYFGGLLSTEPFAVYSFNLLTGALPPGLSLDSPASSIYGTPTTTGTFSFTLQATNAQGCTGTRSYQLTISSSLAALTQLSDYDGDGKSDPSLWSPTNGEWRILYSRAPQPQTLRWGTAGDRPLLGDYDGDGKTDVAIFRPSDSTWYVKQSRDGAGLVKRWGQETDVPVPGDYDGDGKTDIAVWRGAEGGWYILRSADQQYEVSTWGAANAPFFDVPVPGDYDGDGKTDLAVFRRANGTWYVRLSSTGQALVRQWGLGADVPVPGDYDGDGKCDIAVWRSETSAWYIWQSRTSDVRITLWGTSLAPYYDQAVPSDYDGDGKTDIAVWRAMEQSWYILKSGDSSLQLNTHGRPGDVPVTVQRP